MDRVFRVVDRGAPLRVGGREFHHLTGPIGHAQPVFRILGDRTQDAAVDHGLIRLEERDVVGIIDEPTTVNILLFIVLLFNYIIYRS